MRRGLTLIETLASLALLALIASAAAGWIATASAFSARAADQIVVDSAVEAVFTQLQDDLSSGDFPRPEHEPAVTIVRDGFSLGPRPVGSDAPRPMVRAYRLTPGGNLVVENHEPGSHGPARTRALLNGVRRWEGAYDPDTRRLSVRLVDARGVEHVRRFRAP
jgi:prepilin-type N-terminal cleavage/methylation domain-containing protein